MLPISDEISVQLKEEGLRYCSDTTPGFFRQKVRKKFHYYLLNGDQITDKKTLSRIDGLIIPPAWKNVWIAPIANCHLQATGKDQKERKQYLYHPDWIKISKQNKFSKLIDFGLSLPKIRARVKADLNLKKLEKRKILATLIWLLEHTFIRIGNEEYAKDNHSFGLTTLRNRHVKVDGPQIFFKFRGKSGVDHQIEVINPEVARTIRRCIELPGYELFQFIDSDGERHVVDSGDVNEFLKELTLEDFSAKDFRTWGGSKIGALTFYEFGEYPDKKTLKTNIKQTVKKVSKHLNNTVSVCRNYYIHPTVFYTYEEKILVPHFSQYKKSAKIGLSANEYALIKLLEKYPINI